MKIYNVPDAIQRAAQAQAPGLGKNPVARAGAPICLRAELGSLAAGATNVFPTIDLQPGFRSAYWIDEVTITIGETGAATAQAGGLPLALALKFSTGQYNVSKVAMPAALYAPIQGYDELDRGVVSAGNTRPVYQNYRWLLPKPLYMPPADILQCSVTRDVTYASAATMIGINIAYKGRACAPGEAPPQERHVPWVAFYKHANTSRASNTVDEFRNPFLKDWSIQRLIARYGALTFGDFSNVLVPVWSAQGALPDPAGALGNAEVMISDTMGYSIVPTLSPLGTVCDPMRASWTFARAVSAREQLNVNFRTNNFTTGQFDTYVSAIGYRAEAV